MRNKVDDARLVAAMRQRILDEINRRQEAHTLVNNIYGNNAGGPGESSHGVADQLGHSTSEQDPYDYFVDITKEDMPVDPKTGKSPGWKKGVHRHREEKKKMMGENSPQTPLGKS